jgi:hypothetical protein
MRVPRRQQLLVQFERTNMIARLDDLPRVRRKLAAVDPAFPAICRLAQAY